MNRRKSVSLLCFSDISSKLDVSKKPISSDTLGSGSSIWTDSGFNHSENSLSSDKNKNKDFVNSQEKIRRLEEDLKYKDLIISSLYEINNSLRMKLAKAENKIFELRVKSESHCKCCANKSPGNSLEYFSPETMRHHYKYSVSPITKSEPCLVVQPPVQDDTKRTDMKKPPDNEFASPHVAAFNKVTQWQNTFNEEHKKLVSSIPPKISSPSNEPSKTCSRPESLPHALSYMETSRALIETYRKRQEKSPDLISFQVIGDHSVAVSPIQFVQGCHVAVETDAYINEFGKRKSDLQESRKVALQLLPGKQSLLGNILFRNQKSSGLSDCLSKAQEYAATLSSGLTMLPNTLHEIRSLSNQIE